MDKVHYHFFRRLNFNKAPHFVRNCPTLLVLIRPLGSKLYRVFQIPKGLTPQKQTEVRQVLNTLCLVYRMQVWYFRISGPQMQDEISEIFLLMEVQPIFIVLDADRALSN